MIGRIVRGIHASGNSSGRRCRPVRPEAEALQSSVMTDEEGARIIEEHRRRIASLPQAMRHYYSHRRANESIGLYRGPLRVTVEGVDEPITATGSIALQWLPTPRIVYQTELDVDPVTSFRVMGGDVTIT